MNTSPNMNQRMDEHLPFFGLPEFDEGNFRVLSIPWDDSSSYQKGASEAPSKIIKATDGYLYESLTEDLTDISEKYVYEDLGEIELEGEQFNDLIEKVDKKVKKDYREDAVYLFLGGDHSITYPIMNAFEEYISDDFGIIQFDAHPDLYDELDGDKYSHASPFRRIIEDGIIDSKNLIQIGIRASTKEQRAYAQKNDIKQFSVNDISKLKNLDIGFKKAYISIDLDVLDPAFAPGVGNPEPGGFSTRELIELVKSLDVEVKAFDIVEYNPKKDTSKITAYAAAKLIKEILGLNFKRDFSRDSFS